MESLHPRSPPVLLVRTKHFFRGDSPFLAGPAGLGGPPGLITVEGLDDDGQGAFNRQSAIHKLAAFVLDLDQQFCAGQNRAIRTSRVTYQPRTKLIQ